jgi:hypothetical protein
MSYRTLLAVVGLFAGSCLAADVALADGAAIVQNLRSTPASRFDLSLASLTSMVNAEGAAAGYGGFAGYEDGSIVIRAYAPTAKPNEAACKRIMDHIKRSGGVDPTSGQPDDPASSYASLFSYGGDEEAKIDPSYAETVDSMFSVMVVIGETGDGKGIVCQGRLLSNKISYQRQ